MSKEIFTILVLFNYTSCYLKFCKNVCLFEIAWLRAFQKCIFYHFLDILDILLIFFADYKSRAEVLQQG